MSVSGAGPDGDEGDEGGAPAAMKPDHSAGRNITAPFIRTMCPIRYAAGPGLDGMG